jgi:phosphoribosyl 1,2-cyclic phosphodiesterase
MNNKNTIKFLGTAGARFVVTKQIRHSGGIWVNIEGTNILIDPGPGSLVRCLSSRPKLEPTTLSGIILTHRHIDHSNDVNIIAEAMSEGGTKKRGVIFIPSDCLGEDRIVLKYIENYVEKIEIIKENTEYQIGNIKFLTSPRHIHPVETYGLKFNLDNLKISFISDTKFFPELLEIYFSDILIINVVLKERREIDHLCLEDVKELVCKIRPKVAFITHFGMNILKEGPYLIAKEIERETNVKVVAASDGMSVDLEKYL